MMRSVMIYGGLLVASLVVAWLRFTAEPEPDLEGDVAVLQGDAEDIEKIVWNTEEDEITITARSDDKGPYLWVEVTHYKEQPVQNDPPEALEDPEDEGEEGEEGDEGEETPEEPEMERVGEDSIFMAGDKGQELLDALSPMMAIRKLEGVNEEKLESIGLKEPKGEMQVVRKGRTATLQIGGAAFGTRDVYMQDPADKSIYLINDETIRLLRYARTRLPNRELTSFEPNAIRAASLAKDGMVALELTHQNPADEENARWVRTASPDAEDMQVNTWMGKAVTLRASQYADPDEPPTDLEPRFTLKLTAEDGTVENIEVFQSGEDWWGKSEYTRGLVKLLTSSASALSEDVPDILNGGSSEGGDAPD